MSSKKRKRRSFWEPESKRVVDWLNAQDNVSTSLQLIITDAIRRYGDGDAITNHIMGMEEDPIDDLRVDVKPVTRQPRVSKKKIEPEVNIEPTQIEVPEEEVEIEKEVDVVEDIKPVEVIKPVEIEKPKVVVAQEEEIEDDDEYDPISVMMGDIGARLDS